MRWLPSKKLNFFRISGFWSLFFKILTSVFPQRCVNCILNVPKNFWRDFFSLRAPGMIYQYRFFGNISWALFPKNFSPNFQNSIRSDQSSTSRRINFFTEMFFFLKLEFLGYRRKLFRFLSKKRIGGVILLWFLCVKSRILKKDGSFKTVINFAIFCRRRTKTNWVFPETFSMFFKAGVCVPRSTFSGKTD